MAQNKGRSGKDKTDEVEIVDDNYITLEFEDGLSMECEILGVFEVEGKEYIALLPGDGTDDVFIYGYRELSEDEFEILDLDEEEEFEKVSAAFEKLSLEEIIDLDDE